MSKCAKDIVDTLITDNIQLVYFCFNKLTGSSLMKRYREDIIAEGMLGLVKAAKSFDFRRKTKFSTYAIMCIQNQMLMFIRKLNKFVPYEVSLNQPIANRKDGSECCYIDILVDNTDFTDMAVMKNTISEFIAKQCKLDKRILSGIWKGMNQREIANAIGVSQSYVSRRICGMRKKYKQNNI